MKHQSEEKRDDAAVLVDSSAVGSDICLESSQPTVEDLVRVQQPVGQRACSTAEEKYKTH